MSGITSASHIWDPLVRLLAEADRRQAAVISHVGHIFYVSLLLVLVLGKYYSYFVSCVECERVKV